MESTDRRAVAVVGIGSIMPDAPDVTAFWQNLTSGRYSISEVPDERWNPDWYYDPDHAAPDKTYSKIGGWVRSYEWDPLGWHLPIPPKVAEAMDPAQHWAVACTRAALLDFGWPERHLVPERTAVIIGNAMAGERHYRSALRVDFPEFAARLRGSPSFRALPGDVQEAVVAEAHAGFRQGIPAINEDTMPGELANIIAGRVANLFDLHGPNYVTDAACASAMAAIDAAIEGLEEREFDAVITGGIDRNMGAATFVKFCKIGALSATGTRPYGAGADGFVMGEGAALFVLKRLEDAERDGDSIYAVIRGVAGSSDGRGKGITAPNPIGQRLAVERAWAAAGLDPTTATYIEGHGTSTKVGDVVECEALSDVLSRAGAAPGSIGLGSVKSNIGHLKGAAGAAGVLKAVLALHHRQLPPSLSADAPNPKIDFARSPLRVVHELQDWEPNGAGVRRAGVSAFGFGGTNFHIVLEEHVPGRLSAGSGAVAFEQRPAALTTAPGAAGGAARVRVAGASPVAKAPLRNAVVVGGDDEHAVAERLRRLDAVPTPAPAPPSAADLAAPVRVAIDFADRDELLARARTGADALDGGAEAPWRLLANQGAFVGRGPAAPVAFLYTGQGSQYLNMLGALARMEPIVAEVFARADRVMEPLLGRPLTDLIFTEATDEETLNALGEHLRQTEITQPAVLATDLALTRLLAAYGIEPDMVMGHSLGEYGALVASGALTFEAALEAVSARGREMADLTVEDNGAMAAVMAPLPRIQEVLDGVDGYVVIANVNSNGQGVIGGSTAAVEAAVEACTAQGLTAVPIPVSHAFHTSIVAPASEPLRETLRRLDLRAPALPVVANVTGELYPAGGSVEQMIDLLGRQVASPVQFVRGLGTLHEAGARVFVEVGPKKALHGFAQDVLGDRADVTVLFTNHPKQGDVVAFNRALCGLWAAGHGAGVAPEPSPPVAVPSAPAPTREPAPVAASAPSPARAPVPVPPPDVAGGLGRDDTYRELGRLVAEFFDRNQEIHRGGARDGRPLDTEPVVVTGAALGLPGTEKVFGAGDLRRILDGEQLIDQIPNRARNHILEKHIVRLVKRDRGEPTFEEIETPDEVIKLAGRSGRVDLDEFGIDPDRVAAFDTVTRLAVGAGVEALRDAGLPVVMPYRTTSLGSQLPDHWKLPEELRDDTGVIFASAFPGLDSLVADLDHFHEDRSRRQQVELLERVRSRMVPDTPAMAEIDHEIHALRAGIEREPFRFDRRFLFRVLAMGHAQFAELIGARGPNTQVNAACASTTQAVTLAEDWIRCGRCRRVVIVAADDASSDHLIDWIGSGFLASGAAAIDGVVEEAALPFDNRRHGMILGMGAAALVVESRASARDRGIRPICEVLGAVTANSAFHGTRLDVDHISQVMEETVAQAEARGIDRHAIAPETVFVSHETYTPARGGSASAEIHALREVFAGDADRIVIANTKGLTGHPMGAGIEDVVAVKALETGVVPPVPNFKEVDPELGELNLSVGGTYPVRYALRLAAGFGSQISMLLLRWTPMPGGVHREPDQLGYEYRIEDPAAWSSWLARVGGPEAQVEVVGHWLRVADRGPRPAVAAPPRRAAGASEPTAPAAPAEPAAGGDGLVERVLAMVAEATGYPVEMLDPDLDLEADLGIDTVKQAEVFGSIRESFGIERDDRLRLRDYPTLHHVVGFVRERAVGLDGAAAAGVPVAAGGASATPVAAPPPVGSLDAADRVPRRVPVPHLRPGLDACVATGVVLGEGSRVVVMADAGGVGVALRALLRDRGVDVLLVEGAPEADPLVETVAAWRGDRPVDGVYWLPALDAEPPIEELGPDRWREAARLRAHLLHRVARHLYDDLADAGHFLLAGTRLGGRHGYGPEGATAPMGGAVTGFVKALKRERPDALVKAVDVAAGVGPEEVATTLLAETLRDPGCVEVGHRDGDRWTIGLREVPAADGGPGLELGPESVFVVTGAAGSIVSAIVADLARHSGGTFHLLDLTPEPDPGDEDLRRLSRDREGLRHDIFERLKAGGARVTPVMVDREMGRLERLDAALAAVEAVHDAGGRARYHPVDLTDAEAVRSVVDGIRAEHGRVDVLIHAAGLEISHMLPDKSPEEFALVFGVKADGWLNLLRAAGDLPIGATVVFSSVAGRFGNGGQTDYSAANDLLCKYSASFRTTRPDTRAIAIDWTAWADIGMATRGSIPKMMAAAGIEMLPAAAGIATVRRELTAGSTRGEVVVAGALGVLAEDVHPTGGLEPGSIDTGGCGPMVGRVEGMGVHRGLTVATTLDPKAHNFLDHHRIDGIPVLPGVMGIEAFAETARLLRPDLHVTAVEDVEFLAPFKLYRDEPRDVLVTAHFRRDGDEVVADCALIGRRVLAGQDQAQVTTHFTGSVRLGPEPPEAPAGEPAPAPEAAVLRPAAIYDVYFHGPAYQVLAEAWRSGDRPVGRLAADLPANQAPVDAPLTMSPRLIELCFQVVGVSEIGRAGTMGLPNRVGRVATFADPASAKGRLHAVAREHDDGSYDCRVVDEEGRVLVALDGYRTIAVPEPVDEVRAAPFRRAMG